MAREHEAERPWTGDKVHRPLCLRAAASEVGYDFAVFVYELEVNAARLASYWVSVHVVEEMVLALRHDLSHELTVSGDAALDNLIEG